MKKQGTQLVVGEMRHQTLLMTSLLLILSSQISGTTATTMAFINADTTETSFQVAGEQSLYYTYTDNAPDNLVIVESTVQPDGSVEETLVAGIDTTQYFPEYEGSISYPDFAILGENEFLGMIWHRDNDGSQILFFHGKAGTALFKMEFDAQIADKHAGKSLYEYNGRYFLKFLRGEELVIYEYKPNTQQINQIVAIDGTGEIEGSVLFDQAWNDQYYYLMLSSGTSNNYLQGIWRYNLETAEIDQLINGTSEEPLGFAVSDDYLFYTTFVNETTQVFSYDLTDRTVVYSKNSSILVYPVSSIANNQFIAETKDRDKFDRFMTLYSLEEGINTLWDSSIGSSVIAQASSVSDSNIAVLIHRLDSGLVSSYLLLVSKQTGGYDLQERRDPFFAQQRRSNQIISSILFSIFILFLGLGVWYLLLREEWEDDTSLDTLKNHLEPTKSSWILVSASFLLALIFQLLKTIQSFQIALTTTSDIENSIAIFTTESIVFSATLFLQIFYIYRLINMYSADLTSKRIQMAKKTIIIFSILVIVMTSSRLFLLNFYSIYYRFTIGISLRWYEILYLLATVFHYYQLNKGLKNSEVT